VVSNPDIPTYNLRAVVQETGLKAETLRAWERRYGLPVPERSEGGHRLYSRRDIEILKWLTARVEEGLAISRAVDLWRNLEAEGEDPISTMVATGVSLVRPSIDSSSSLAEIRDAWIEAGLKFDEQSADSIIAQAFAQFPVETVGNHVLLKAISEIGERWFASQIDVQQEHFITQLTLKRLDALLVASPLPTRLEKIIVACPPGEEHTISLVFLCLGLRRMGFQVYYFGANTPIEKLEEVISSIGPDLAISSSQQLSTALSTRTLGSSLAEAGIPFAYGGRVFSQIPELQSRMPGYFLGDSLENTLDQVEKLLISPQAIENQSTATGPLSPVDDQLLVIIDEIAGTVFDRMVANHISLELSESVILHLKKSMISSLQWGEPALLTAELIWLDGWLDHRIDNQASLGSILNETIQTSEKPFQEAHLILEGVTGYLNKSNSRSDP
jgi:DNA-binding transcriptional MerR regulator